MRFTSSQQTPALPLSASRGRYFPWVTPKTNGVRPGLPRCLEAAGACVVARAAARQNDAGVGRPRFDAFGPPRPQIPSGPRATREVGSESSLRVPPGASFYTGKYRKSGAFSRRMDRRHGAGSLSAAGDEQSQGLLPFGQASDRFRGCRVTASSHDTSCRFFGLLLPCRVGASDPG
jgi:hypothetical protein